MSTNKIRHISYPFESPFFNVALEELCSPNGVFPRYTVEHPGAVVILPIENSGKMLIIKQYRHALREWMYEFPAGTLDKNEEIKTCAQRELEEEIGFAAGDLIPIGKLYPAPGFCNEVQHLFIARELYPSKRENDEDEQIEVESIGLKQFEDLIAEGTIYDAKSLAIVYKAKLLGFI